jgi:fumarate hydratase subunit beta
MIELRPPLSEKTVRELRMGDMVNISGDVITGRDEMHARVMEYSSLGRPLPEGIEGSVIYHCGPIVAGVGGGGWKVVAAGPTTSARMNSAEPEMIRKFHIRAIIGKGGMSKDVGQAMREVGCVYLAAVGGTAVSLAESITEVSGVDWPDLGMAEAMWRFKITKMGALIVAMDAEGNSLYDEVRSELIRNI